MKIRNLSAIGILFLLGAASVGAVVATYIDISAQGSVPAFPGLGNIPSDCQFVFGVNVRKLVNSPAFSKLQTQPVGNDLSSFIEKTGVDPRRDVSYLLGAGRGGAQSRNEGVVIVSGTFNQERINAFIRSKSAPSEVQYAGSTVMMIPDSNNVDLKNGIAFLNDSEIALGELESLKAVLDIKAKGNQSILSSETLAPLIRSIGSGEMFWFAGDASSMLSRAPAAAAAPLRMSASSIRSVVGTLNLTDAVTGRITATALNPDAAVKLADAFRGFIALGQLAGNEHPELKALLGGLAVSQNSTRVSIDLAFSAELLDKLSRPQNMMRQAPVQ